MILEELSSLREKKVAYRKKNGERNALFNQKLGFIGSSSFNDFVSLINK